ncbi:MAG: LLM class F420-dependent oxidoreductase [Rhodospirillales bacterium]|nr:LLM class F420-dependent oxidoreductase [Rhodospirillales bacterium]
MQLGAMLPLNDLGGEPAVVADFAVAAERMGYDYLLAADHVLGVNAASRPDWGNRNTSADLFHDPFVLFGFLAGITSRVGLASGVLILAQRQAALVAKQAASVDRLSGGRLRLGVGIGWNPVEFTALGENFADRGIRSGEQVAVMQALWAQEHVDFTGRWHRIEDAGINPRPAAGRIPVWFGGHVPATLQRCAKLGDGWMMLAHPPGQAALDDFATLRRLTAEAGRDPAAMGIEVWVSPAEGGPAEWRDAIRFWRDAGVSHATLAGTYARNHHKRIEGRTLAAHLSALARYRDAVADLL